MFGRVILGIVIMALGGSMIYYSGALTEKLGRSRWAEEKLGGTMQMRIFIGFCLVVIGGLTMFGIISLISPTNSNVAGL